MGLWINSGRERGIRTPGGSHLNGFQDRRFRPLSHLPKCLGGDTQIRTGDQGFAIPCLSHLAMSPNKGRILAKKSLILAFLACSFASFCLKLRVCALDDFACHLGLNSLLAQFPVLALNSLLPKFPVLARASIKSLRQRHKFNFQKNCPFANSISR